MTILSKKQILLSVKYSPISVSHNHWGWPLVLLLRTALASFFQPSRRCLHTALALFSFPSLPFLYLLFFSLVLSFIPLPYLFSSVFLCFPLSFFSFLPSLLTPPPTFSSSFKRTFLFTVVWFCDQVIANLQMKISDLVHVFLLRIGMCPQRLDVLDIPNWTGLLHALPPHSYRSIFLGTRFLRTVIESLHFKYEQLRDIASPQWTHFAREVILPRISSATCSSFFPTDSPLWLIFSYISHWRRSAWKFSSPSIPPFQNSRFKVPTFSRVGFLNFCTTDIVGPFFL